MNKKYIRQLEEYVVQLDHINCNLQETREIWLSQINELSNMYYGLKTIISEEKVKKKNKNESTKDLAFSLSTGKDISVGGN